LNPFNTVESLFVHGAQHNSVGWNYDRMTKTGRELRLITDSVTEPSDFFKPDRPRDPMQISSASDRSAALQIAARR